VKGKPLEDRPLSYSIS